MFRIVLDGHGYIRVELQYNTIGVRKTPDSVMGMSLRVTPITCGTVPKDYVTSRCLLQSCMQQKFVGE